MGLMIAKNGKIRDFSLPSQRNVRSTDEQNVQFDDVLKKSPHDKYQQQRKHQDSEQERRRNSGIKNYIKQEHHANYQHKHLMARDIGTSPIISIHPEETVGRALEIMAKYKIHHLIILDQKKNLKGIVSDRDLLNKRYNDPLMNHAQMEVIITKDSTDIKILAKIMLEKDISALPYIDQNEVIMGIITKTDILDYLVHALPFETYV